MTLINREDAIDELRRLIPYKKYHKGEWVHLLDKKEVFNMFADYPCKLTQKQKEIFDKENPEWKEFFRDRK